MIRRTFLAALAATGIVLASGVLSTGAWAASPDNTLILETSKGKVTIELRPDLAPKHVAQIKTLVGKHF